MRRRRITVGTDLVHIPRLACTLERLGSTFLDRAFTPAEQHLCAGDTRRLAGRWAAKESVLKALGRGLDEIPMTQIELLATASGAPTLHLSGAAQRLAREQGWSQWSVSVSHDGQYATAVAVALGRVWPPLFPEHGRLARVIPRLER